MVFLNHGYSDCIFLGHRGRRGQFLLRNLACCCETHNNKISELPLSLSFYDKTADHKADFTVIFWLFLKESNDFRDATENNGSWFPTKIRNQNKLSMIWTQTVELSVEIRQLAQSTSLNISSVPTCEVNARSCLWIIVVQKVQRDTKELSLKTRCYDNPRSTAWG